MGTKTIGLDDEAYERLRAEKREDESFSDTVKRLTVAVASDWRHSFGRYGSDTGNRSERADRFEEAVAASRQGMSEGLDERQRRVNDAVRSGDEASGEDESKTDLGEGSPGGESDETPR